MPLRAGEVPNAAEYSKGRLVVTYDDAKRVVLPSVTRRSGATLYDVRALGKVGANETFNVACAEDVSFRNFDRCDAMSYLQMRPWVYDTRRCTKENRCGLNGHVDGGWQMLR